MKKTVSGFLALILATALCLLAGCGSSGGTGSTASPAPGGTSDASPAGTDAPAQTITLTAAHSQSTSDPYHLGLQRFCDLVTERTDGRIVFEIHPNSVLGAEREMVEGVGLGTIDVAVITNALCANVAPQLGCLDFPYLFSSAEEAYAVLDSELGAELLATLEQANIKGLAFMENGFRCLTTKVQVATPADLQGMKVRTMETPVHMAAFEAAGAIVTPIAGNELYTALQQNVVDAQENPLKSIYDQKYYEVAPYILKTEHFYATTNLIINMNKWNSLSEEDRAIMEACAVEATAYQRQTCVDRAAEVTTLMTGAGATITDVSAEEKAVWREAMASVYESDTFKTQYGEWLDKIADVKAKLGY